MRLFRKMTESEDVTTLHASPCATFQFAGAVHQVHGNFVHHKDRHISGGLAEAVPGRNLIEPEVRRFFLSALTMMPST